MSMLGVHFPHRRIKLSQSKSLGKRSTDTRFFDSPYLYIYISLYAYIIFKQINNALGKGSEGSILNFGRVG